MSATASIILDTRRLKIKTKKFPVKLQVSFDRVTLHYQTIFDLSKDDYGKLSSPRIGKGKLKNLFGTWMVLVFMNLSGILL